MRDLTNEEIKSVSGGEKKCTATVTCTADSSGEVSCTATVTCTF